MHLCQLQRLFRAAQAVLLREPLLFGHRQLPVGAQHIGHQRLQRQRIGFERARKAETTRNYDFLDTYVNDLGNVVNLDDCVTGGAQGELAVNARYPVQLSVPAQISHAPWRLLRVYADERNTTTTAYRPGTQLAVTIPTVDPQRGRILGLVVQLLTLVKDQNGELHDLPHAEWSVRLNWSAG